MKHFFYTLLALFVCVSCDKYDDTSLRNEIEDLDQRLELIEQKVDQMNSDLSTLQALMEGKKFITGISTDADGNNVVNFITSNGEESSITITNGEDGKDGETPEIGVAEGSDGEYYWTLDGEFIVVDGNKLPVTGNDAPAPKFKWQDDSWYISYDDGANWEACEMEGDFNLFTDAEVNDEEGTVTLTLADGSAITVELYNEFNVAFADPKTVIKVGESVEVEYTITGATDQTTIEALPSGNWDAQIESSSVSKGVITVTAPEDSSTGKVIVLVNDGGTKTLMRTLNFTAGELSVSDYSVDVASEGGEVTFDVTTDLEYQVVVEEGVEWVRYVETRAVSTQTVALEVDANDTAAERTATIKIMNGDVELERVAIVQEMFVDSTAFDVTLVEAKLDALVVNVAPIGYTGNYYIRVTDKARYASAYASDPQNLIKAAFTYEGQYSTNLSVADNYYVFNGEREIDLSEDLFDDFEENTEYVVCVFGVKGIAGFNAEATTEPVVAEFSTKGAQPFEITLNKANTEELVVDIKSKHDGNYYVCAVKKSSYENIYDASFEEVATSMFGYEFNGTDFSKTDDEWIFNGDQTIALQDHIISNLDYGCEYAVCVFGVDGVKGTNEEITTEVVGGFFATTEPVLDDTFNVAMTVEVTSTSSVSVEYDASSAGIDYFFGVVEKYVVDTADDKTQLMRDLTQGVYMFWDNVSWGDFRAPYSGLMQGIEYYAFAFAVDGSTQEPLSDMFCERFSLDDSKVIDLSDMTIPDVEFGEFETYGATDNTFNYKATPNEGVGSYMCTFVAASYFYSNGYDTDPEKLVREDMEYIRYLGAINELVFTDTLDALLYEGNINELADELNSGTDYVCYVYGYSKETYKPTTKVMFEKITTTGVASYSAPSSAAIVKRHFKL